MCNNNNVTGRWLSYASAIFSVQLAVQHSLRRSLSRIECGSSGSSGSLFGSNHSFICDEPRINIEDAILWSMIAADAL